MQLRLLGEWRGIAAQRLEPLSRLGERRVIESRADMRGVAQLLATPIAQEQRAERGARAFAARIAAHDEIPALRRLGLEPCGRGLAGLGCRRRVLAAHAF